MTRAEADGVGQKQADQAGRSIFGPRLGLNCEALTTFGTTGIDNGSTPFGFHAGAKAVGTFTTNGRGLVSAFHEYPSENADPTGQT